MFKIYYRSIFESQSNSFLPYFSIVISILSVLAALNFIFITKRIEIINSKFQKFCIVNLDELFKGTDSALGSNLRLNKFKRRTTDVFGDIQIYLASLKKIYPKIDNEEIIKLIEDYTDYVYEINTLDYSDIKGKYMSTKLLIYEKLYVYALRNELSLFERLGLKSKMHNFYSYLKSKMWLQCI